MRRARYVIIFLSYVVCIVLSALVVQYANFATVSRIRHSCWSWDILRPVFVCNSLHPISCKRFGTLRAGFVCESFCRSDLILIGPLLLFTHR